VGGDRISIGYPCVPSVVEVDYFDNLTLTEFDAKDKSMFITGSTDSAPLG